MLPLEHSAILLTCIKSIKTNFLSFKSGRFTHVLLDLSYACFYLQACQAVCYVNMLLQECQCFERGYEHIAMKKNSDARQCRSDTGQLP